MRPLLLLLYCGVLGAAADIDQLGFFSGCWSMTRDGVTVDETWNKPAGGTLTGIGRTVKDGKTAFTELMQIREENGKLAFVVQLKMGGPVTVFPVLSLTATEVVFSNPEHDYPQRVIYRKQADGSLLGRTEGRQRGKETSEDFAYRRVKCE